MESSCEISGWGKCLPPGRLTNDQLARVMDTSDQWIRSRTGIEERRVSHVPTSELGRVAAQRALDAAGLEAEQLDLIIFASASPDTLIPCIAATLQHRLGAVNAATFDLNSGCTGFIYGLASAASFIGSGLHQRVLLVGAERLTWLLDWTQRETAVLFGDGAGAVVLEASSQTDLGPLGWDLGCDGSAEDALKVPGFGTNADRTDPNVGRLDVLFDGREIFRNAVRGMAQSGHRAARNAGVKLTDIQGVIPHQANRRIIDAVGRALGVSAPVFVNIERYGNTSAATIPIALTEALESGWLKPRQLLLLVAFGAGLTRAGLVLRWGDRVAPRKESSAELPPCDRSAIELIADSIEFSRAEPRA